MDAQTLVAPTRRPRFRRASEPPAFRLTDDDVHIVRQLARHRFLKSTHIAALVGRSLDRTNDRLLRLFHAGYIDRPRAQLDYYPTAGSSPIAYALADRGARLLIQRDGIEFANVEWSRKNRRAGRPFIEHQLEIVDFSVALQLATGARRDVQFIHPNDIIAAFPEQTRAARNPLSLRVKLSHQGVVHEIGLVPDLVFGLQFPDGSRHSFMVEIDAEEFWQGTRDHDVRTSRHYCKTSRMNRLSKSSILAAGPDATSRCLPNSVTSPSVWKAPRGWP
jgi:DNA-binding Lrp family transcriptional regulator